MTGVPFRWDLVAPDQLGSLLEGVPEPPLQFGPELARCSGQVLARSGNGDLAFIGRSLDSMYDFLSGALSGVRDAPALHRVPLSFARDWAGRSRRTLTASELQVARGILEAAGCAPRALVRRSRPLTFVDVAHTGGTFGDLYELISDWVAEERAPWSVARTKVRFIGVTSRKKTSPNTVRWAQQQRWTSELPAKSVLSVSLDPHVWSYFGDHQLKLTRSWAPSRWLAEQGGPGRDERTRTALAEAVAVVAFGRTRDGRQQIANAMDGEPALAESWLRRLRSALLSN